MGCGWAGDDGGGAGGEDRGDGDGGAEFCAFGADDEEGGACACYGGGVCVVQASELLGVFLVGGGESGRVGEWGVCGGVRVGAVAVFWEQNR